MLADLNKVNKFIHTKNFKLNLKLMIIVIKYHSKGYKLTFKEKNEFTN